ncbi:MAG: hypothetical protein M1828_001215 [Chrysothrix sp. TS-e1954]|nr:MAG: hypothetical protein M1828_001215 [Chrysothrix sp. TS-e1954]
MSFGFGVGDFLAVSELAWKIYKAVKEAPHAFQDIHQELQSFTFVLREVQENVTKRKLSPQQEERLGGILSGCQHVLEDLENLVERYQGLLGKSGLSLDRPKFAGQNVVALRMRLISNMNMLTGFMMVLPALVEQQLERFLLLYRGQKAGSISSGKTFDSLSTYGRASWRSVRKDLQSVGMSVEAFESNRDYILDWFTQASASGAFPADIVSADDEDDDDNMDARSVCASSCSTAEGAASLHRSGSTHAGVVVEDSAEPQDQSAHMGSIRDTESPPQETPELESPAQQSSAQASRSQVLRVASKSPRPVALSQISLLEGLSATVFRQRKRFLRAAGKGDMFEVAQFLTGKVAYQVDQDTNNLALMQACRKTCDKSTVRALLQGGADPNASFEKGIKITHFGPRVSWGNFKGCTALMMAAYRGSKEVVEILLQSGATLDCHVTRPCPVGELDERVVPTPLAFAVQSGSLATVKAVVSAGAVIDERKDTYTAFHQVCKGWRMEICQELLDRGASLEDECKEGSPLMVALLARQPEIVEILVKKGAEVSHRSENPTIKGHKTPMEVAMYISKQVEKKMGKTAMAEEVNMVELLRVRGASMTEEQLQQLETWRKVLKPHAAFLSLIKQIQHQEQIES